jgi:hypothetical protein
MVEKFLDHGKKTIAPSITFSDPKDVPQTKSTL